MKMLLDAGADVNAPGKYGTASALYRASWYRFPENIKMLLDAGADVNAQGGEYGSALQAASSNGNFDIMRMLLDAGADVNAQGGRYGNVLQSALRPVFSNDNFEAVKMLVDADVNAHGGEYGNALQAAVQAALSNKISETQERLETCSREQETLHQGRKDRCLGRNEEPNSFSQCIAGL